MTLRQSQFVPPVPLIVAEAGGMLGAVDLAVERTTGSPEQLARLMSGEIDIAITAIDNLYAWTAAGADVRLIAQTETTTPLGVYGQPGMADLTHLQGHRFGVDAMTNGFALVARYVLERAHVDVEFAEVGGVKERLEALTSRDVAGTLLGPPFDAMAAAAGLPLLTPISSVLPALPGQGLVVRTDVAESDELAAYLEALDLATCVGATMSDEAGERLLSSAGFGAAAGTAWATRPHTMAVDGEGLKLIAEIRRSLGLMPAGIGLEDLHDPAPLARAVANTAK